MEDGGIFVQGAPLLFVEDNDIFVQDVVMISSDRGPPQSQHSAVETSGHHERLSDGDGREKSLEG